MSAPTQAPANFRYITSYSDPVDYRHDVFRWEAQSGNSVKIQYKNAMGETMTGDGGEKWYDLKLTSAGASEYVRRGGYNGHTKFRAQAVNNDGFGPWSNEIFTAFPLGEYPQVTDLVVESNTSSLVTLRFNSLPIYEWRAITKVSTPLTGVSETQHVITWDLSGDQLVGRVSFRPVLAATLHIVKFRLFQGVDELEVLFTSAIGTFWATRDSSTSSSTVGVAGTTFARYSSNLAATWSIASGSLPPGLSLSAGPSTTAQITGTPTTAGAYTFTARATYDTETRDASSTSITIYAAQMTVSSPSSAVGRVGVAFGFTISATSNNGAGAADTFGATGLPAWASRSGATISGTPDGPGQWSVTVTAWKASNEGLVGSQTLIITVAAFDITNSETAIAAAPGTRTAVNITHNGGWAVVMSKTSGPAWASVEKNGGVWQLVLVPIEFGAADVVVAAVDGSATASETFRVTVAPSAAPVVDAAQGILGYGVNERWEFQPAATNSPSLWVASGLPPGVTIDPSTGKISGAATVKGQYNVTVRASNSIGLSAAVQFFVGIDDAGALDPGTGSSDFDKTLVYLYVDLVSRHCTASLLGEPASEVLFLKEGDTVLLVPRFYRMLNDAPDWVGTPSLVFSALKFALKNYEEDGVLVESDPAFASGINWVIPTEVAGDALAAEFADNSGKEAGDVPERVAAFIGLGEIEWQYRVGVTTYKGSTRAFPVRVERDIVA